VKGEKKKPLSERRGYLTAVNTHMRKNSVYQWHAIETDAAVQKNPAIGPGF
jgi:hypothetical protein